MPDNTNNFINSIRRTSTSNQGPANDRGSLLAQSLTYSRAGSNSRAVRTPTSASGASGRSNGSTTGAGNIITSGPTGSVNDATVLSLFDLNGDKQISDKEIVDVSLKRNFRDADMAASYNAKAGDITRLVKKADADLNGEISDVELAKALLADRRGELPDLSADIKNYLFNKNLNRATIERELNYYDNADGTGGTLGDHVISDLEVLDKLTALKAAGTTITAATRAVLGTNPHYMKIQELVNNTNFTEINTPQETFDFLLAARKYGVEDVFATRELSGNEAILNLVKAVDKDADGIISQREFIAGYVAINKKGNPDQLDSSLFNTLIASQESFSSIPTFIDSVVDNNGNINETQAATLIATNKNSLTLDVAKELSSNTQFKNLLNLLKPDAEMSSGELVSVILASRNPAFSNIESAVFSNLINIDAGQGEAYNDAIIDIDQNNNGAIDNSEVSRAMLRNNSGDTTYSDEMLTAILSTNAKYADIKRIVDIFDAEATKDGVYSNEEMLKGLLEVKKLKLTVTIKDPEDKRSDNDLLQELLNLALNNNDLLHDLPKLVNLFDPGASGTISEEAYAKVIVGIAKGSQADIDPNLLAIIETQVPSATTIKDAVQAFANDFNKDFTAEELLAKFRPLVSDSDGNIDPNKLSTMTKVMKLIYPNSDNLINLSLNFDTNHDNTLTDSELIQGLLKYNSGQLGTVSNTALNSIIQKATHPNEIKYALSIIDTKGDGSISDLEVVNALVQINRGDFENDTKFNADIFSGILNEILETNSNHAVLERVMSTFNYATGFKPTTMDLAASVMVQNHLQRVTNDDKDKFLKAIDMFGKTSEINAINAEITKLSTISAFDTNNKIKTDVLLDKSILISMGKLSSSAALTAVLRSNSEYANISRLFGKYSESKKLTENSLVKILVDANISDDKLKLDGHIKDYFINLLNGEVGSLTLDYAEGLALTAEAAVKTATPANKAAAEAAAATARSLATKIKNNTATEIEKQSVENLIKNELLGSTIITEASIANYTNAIGVLDSDRNGKMTSNDFFLHQYYFSNEFSTAGAQYDFDTNGTVDAADKAIFDRVANYLKVNS